VAFKVTDKPFLQNQGARVSQYASPLEMTNTEWMVLRADNLNQYKSMFLSSWAIKLNCVIMILLAGGKKYDDLGRARQIIRVPRYKNN
jgi:hypothetical protein